MPRYFERAPFVHRTRAAAAGFKLKPHRGSPTAEVLRYTLSKGGGERRIVW